MVDRHSDTTIRRQEDKVIFTNQQTQTFEQEDFVQVFNDNINNYEQLKNQLDQFQEQRQELIEENEDELAALNYVLGNETPYTPEEEGMEGSIGSEVFETHQQLQQLKEQIENLESQKERLEEQLGQMQPVAKSVAEELDMEVEDY